MTAPVSASGDADAGLTEKTLSSAEVWQGRFLRIRRDTVRLPDGAETTREYVVHPGAVVVVPWLDDGRLLLERQHRHPLGAVLLEFPAGKIDPGEAPLACGQRELEEETGYRADEWARAGRMHNAAAYSTEAIDIWFARGLHGGSAKLDEGEFIELRALGIDELAEMIVDGRVTDAKTQIGYLWARQWQAGAWPLEWHRVAG